MTDERVGRATGAEGPIALFAASTHCTRGSCIWGITEHLLCLKRFQQAGHKPVALVGGAGSLIGDPASKPPSVN
ncbi:hypothetical protein KCP69_15160 [Salmonella enterica subsp. enterica]|nr:hypothetical protein KCP69_15160 [Salmonella enterica subsp. enterica]